MGTFVQASDTDTCFDFIREGWGGISFQAGKEKQEVRAMSGLGEEGNCQLIHLLGNKGLLVSHQP